ncbi:SAM-dependent methyltransferase [Paracoccus sp. 08]|uniref:SAM-dependent methyltransferase n=1 Tax=Paracoccus sp. 08 TaxID=2606624 RepID=UPI0020944364|nr:SAM-dependent methyltransferase [Paracoccus sp. 08]
MSGTLTVVGSGIKAGAHLTSETISWITTANKVFYLVADPVSEFQIKNLNATCESLSDCYRDGESRSVAYERMIERVVSSLSPNQTTVVVLYGHPGVFVYPSFEMLSEARHRGYSAIMLPAISADSCLFADLEIDPARDGCQSFEATDFLLHERLFDPRSLLILWQIGTVGDGSFQANGYRDTAIVKLVEALLDKYPEAHEVIVYEASQYAMFDPVINKCRLSELASAPITPISTLVVPPIPRRPVSQKALDRLGLSRGDIIIEKEK